MKTPTKPKKMKLQDRVEKIEMELQRLSEKVKTMEWKTRTPTERLRDEQTYNPFGRNM